MTISKVTGKEIRGEPSRQWQSDPELGDWPAADLRERSTLATEVSRRAGQLVREKGLSIDAALRQARSELYA